MKYDPGGKPNLDALLKEWPAPSRAEPAWDAQADAIARTTATSRAAAGGSEVDALLLAPALPAEPGEPGATVELRVSGERKMSDDKEHDPGPTPSQASQPPRSKQRQSLREIAERARSSTPAPSRTSAVSTPLPGSISTPVPPPAASSSKSAVSTPLPRPATATPIPSRPAEAGKEDSGIVDLNVVRASATPEQVADAERAKPGTEGLFDDDKAPASAKAAPPASARAASAKAPAAAAAAPAKKKSSGAGTGIVIAIVGLAAAAGFVAWKQPARFRALLGQQPAPVVAEAKPPTPTPTAEATGEVAATPTAEATGAPGAPGDEAPGAVAVAPRPGVGAPWPAGRPGAAPAPQATTDPKGAPTPPPAPDKQATKGGDKPGDLAGAMEKAVGPTDKSTDATGQGEPASGSKSSSVPEQPPQGSVSAAVGSVMGGAKACVAGADDVSRATITFGSNGSVSSVTVTGWAAAHGATGCIKSALQGAKVGAFSKPSFSVGVTIRP